MKKEFKVGDIIRAEGGLSPAETGTAFSLPLAVYLNEFNKLKILKVEFDGALKVVVVDTDPEIKALFGVHIIGKEGFISPRQVTKRIVKKAKA
jgi:hypothetical protein